MSNRRVVFVGTVLLVLIVQGFDLAAAQDDEATALELREKAISLIDEGEYDAALEALDAAGEAASEDVIERVRLELLRANVYRARGELTLAASIVDDVLVLARTSGEPDTIARCLLRAARLARDRGDTEREASALAEVKPLVERTADGELRGQGFAALALYSFKQGEGELGLEQFSKALAAAKKANAIRVEIAILVERSSSLLGISRYDDALADAQRAYELREFANRTYRAAVVFTLAQANAHLWNLDRAAELWTEAIASYREAEFPIGVAMATKQRMDTWLALDDLDRAADDGEAALSMFEAMGSTGAFPEIFTRLALVEMRRGDSKRSCDYEARGLSLLENTVPERRIFMISDLALVALDSDRLAEARKRFERALALARELTDPEYEWRALDGLGRVALRGGEPATGERYFEQAVALIERLRRGLPEAGQRASLISGRIKPYERWIEALMAQARSPDDPFVQKALEISERARGRAMADLLAESRARLSDPGVAAIKEEEAVFSRRLSALQKELMSASDASARARLQKELSEAERAFDALVIRMRRDNPNYAALAHPETANLSEIEELLVPGEALIEYSLGDDAGFAWMLRSGESVTSFTVPGRTELGPKIRLLLGAVSSGDDSDVEAVGRELYDSLLRPSWEALRDVDRLLIVADGPLRRLPFALLRHEQGRWLVQDKSLTSIPSATLLRELRREAGTAADEPILAFSYAGESETNRAAELLYGTERSEFSRLEHAEREARDVARILKPYGSSAVVRNNASERTVKQSELDRFRILHFAVHTMVDEVVPRRSAMLLASDDVEDGLLQLNEVTNLSLSAELVVLATCRSYLGRSVRGEGLLSLARSFMYAGADAVVSTLWSVDDAETRRLMVSFYGGIRDGLAVDEALRSAQLARIAEGASPASWAGFMVTGDGARSVFGPHELKLPTALMLSLTAFIAVILSRAMWVRRRQRGAVE